MIRVEVALALPETQVVVPLELPDGSTVADALAACREGGHLQLAQLEGCAVGIWSRQASADTALRDHDRVEVYRPLKADAKAMRRSRARLKPASPRSRNGP